MAQLSIMGVLSLCLVLPTTRALPQFWPHAYSEKPYPTLTISSSAGVYPTGSSGTIAAGSGTAYYPTATGNPYIAKRDSDHPFGYPPPYKPSFSSDALPTGFPTASAPAPPVLSTFVPTGTAPSASGTGVPYPTYVPNRREVDTAKQMHRQHFEGPRKRQMKPYYPYVPSQSYGGAGPSTTAPSGATGTGGIIFPVATGTGVIPFPMPTGTSVVPLPVPTGGLSSVPLPSPSGTAGGGYPTAPA